MVETMILSTLRNINTLQSYHQAVLMSYRQSQMLEVSQIYDSHYMRFARDANELRSALC